MPTPTPQRMSLLGSIVWVVGAALLDLSQVASLVVLAPLVLHPLIVQLARVDAIAPRLSTFLRWAQLPAASILVAAFALAPSPIAGVLAVPWLLAALVTALLGLLRLRAVGVRPSAELSISAGLVFVAVGGAWAVCACAGYAPLNFSPTVVVLTAAHFHYAGFVLPVLAGLCVRRVDRPSTVWVPSAIVIGIVLVAAGITTSPLLEVVGAVVLTLAAATTAIAQLSVAAVAARRVAALLLAGSALALVWGVALAAIYGVGEFRGLPWPSIPEMVKLHGTVNALGFALLGTWGWTLEERSA